MRRGTRTSLALLAACCAWYALSTPESLGGGPTAERLFDAARLRTGRFVYSISVDGREMGRITCAVQKRADGNYDFTGETTDTFSQHWEVTATAALEPISATLRVGEDPHKSSLRLSYDGNHVTGQAIRGGGGPKEPATKSIDERVPDGTVDQRVDWAAVLSSRLEPGRTFDFPVYDPWGGVSRVIGRVGEAESVRVPAGTFDAYRVEYRIESSKGSEPYRMLATKEGPRVSLREDQHGTVSELLEIRDPESP